ncbi:anti-sigma factor antagonist [Streptomyces sp. H10-C2]|uniref:anti-sigma factor antagonist n=1 Tax=unclassified Streptomyces TaxID=2593676 RepID=UPI0024B87EE4|nr:MULTISPECIES: anti-sigma factor antagonist [unclassified Streptomyces]MDJ0343413.1 anti-sigma factor antagonist [Streptomyces sp. PH10-H1]MDJ0371776.1 anti-sigma factor antagonist [Streptomyces sp. H10-C2]
MKDDTPPAAASQVPVRLRAAPVIRRPACTYTRDGFTVVELRGEIDLATLPEAGAQLSAGAEHAGARVIVDLRPARFFDCATLTLLVRTRRLLLEGDGWMGLVCVHPWHLRVLRLAGLTTTLRPVATVEEACADAPRRRAG